MNELILKGLRSVKRLFAWLVCICLGKSPVPDEIEKKWIVPTGSVPVDKLISSLPQGFSLSTILQTYLDRPDRPGIECRVREQTFQDGSTSYWYTEKEKTKVKGRRKEKESKISLDKYIRYIRQWADKKCAPIVKIRYVFYYTDPLVGRVKGELDVYRDKLEGLVTLEVELAHVADLERVSPPDFCPHALAVNGAYGNRNLALHGITPELRQLINS